MGAVKTGRGMPRPGARAPAFALRDRHDQIHRLSDFRGEVVVLFFYPRDSTPGCALESREFSRLLPQFRRLNAHVVGISGGDASSKERFCEKEHLKTLMLSDTDYQTATKYGCFGEKKFMGRVFQGIHRTTFVISSSGTIKKIFEGVKPSGHAREVLNAVRELNRTQRSTHTKSSTRSAQK